MHSDEDYSNKIQLLYDFCIHNKITEIAITGGEPFLYISKLQTILHYFTKCKFHITINTNASLVNKYIDYLNTLPYPIEFHVNLSSITQNVHNRITRANYLVDEMSSLKELVRTKHIVKLNIICLKSVNEDELLELNKFAIMNNMFPRYLVLYDTNNSCSNYIMDTEEICKKFDVSIAKKYGYGMVSAKGRFEIEIVKCLCIDKECDRCRNNSFLHLDPNLNIKYCLNSDAVVNVDFSNVVTVTDSFNCALAKFRGF